MKVLIVVDMQKDFVDGSLGTPEAQAIVPLVAETIKQMADPNTVCIFTKDTHEHFYLNTLEGKNLPVEHCIAGTAGHSIVDEVFEAYCCKDFKDPWEVYPLATTDPLRIEKPSFGSVELQNVLVTMNENEPIEEITLMGLCTGICVLSNAILCKATLPEVPVNVVADCCACVTPESHKTALEAMKLCQINII
ncbi:MAG: cysteine hydrolase [Bacteroides sp.]|nr:cysteine hydrolase [Bacteroides sp.]